ncbi:MAG: hypothetical protein ACLSHU_02190 [Oscillospiraceae bacterium]
MQYAQQIMGEVRKAVVGKDRVLLWSLATILARAISSWEDIPSRRNHSGSGFFPGPRALTMGGSNSHRMFCLQT